MTDEEQTAWWLLKSMQRGSNPEVNAEFVGVYLDALRMSRCSALPFRRVYRHANLIELFKRTIDIAEGDIAECGFGSGCSTLELCLTYEAARPGWRGRGYCIFDSFAGLSEPSDHDRAAGMSADVECNMRKGSFAGTVERATLLMHERFPEVRIYPGWIPEAFPFVYERKFKFVHVDVDLYQPSRDSLAFFYPRLVEGGIIVTDDYDWPGARKAFDDYARDHRLTLHTTRTNQAYLINGGADGTSQELLLDLQGTEQR